MAALTISPHICEAFPTPFIALRRRQHLPGGHCSRPGCTRIASWRRGGRRTRKPSWRPRPGSSACARWWK
eukprot:2458597-Pyramimonas_sp.AAC.1